MRFLFICALLVLTAEETNTQPVQKLALNENRKDAKGAISMTTVDEMSAMDTDLQNKITDTAWRDYMPRKRRQRAAVIVGKSMMNALRAVNNLLFGTKQIPSVSKYKLHAKQGGLGRAEADFESIYLKNVKYFSSKFQFGRSGQIGNREIILRYSERTQTPSIDIVRLHNDAQPGASLPGELTDRIIYMKNL